MVDGWILVEKLKWLYLNYLYFTCLVSAALSYLIYVYKLGKTEIACLDTKVSQSSVLKAVCE